jgi:hypothetical protein
MHTDIDAMVENGRTYLAGRALREDDDEEAR